MNVICKTYLIKLILRDRWNGEGEREREQSHTNSNTVHLAMSIKLFYSKRVNLNNVSLNKNINSKTVLIAIPILTQYI